jgi:hypothetical protein
MSRHQYLAEFGRSSGPHDAGCPVRRTGRISPPTCTSRPAPNAVVNGANPALVWSSDTKSRVGGIGANQAPSAEKGLPCDVLGARDSDMRDARFGGVPARRYTRSSMPRYRVCPRQGGCGVKKIGLICACLSRSPLLVRSRSRNASQLQKTRSAAVCDLLPNECGIWLQAPSYVTVSRTLSSAQGQRVTNGSPTTRSTESDSTPKALVFRCPARPLRAPGTRLTRASCRSR